MRLSPLVISSLLCVGSFAHGADTNIHPVNGRNAYASNFTFHQGGGLPGYGVNVASGLIFGFHNGELWSGTANNIRPVSTGGTSASASAAAGNASASTAAIKAAVRAPDAHLLSLDQAANGRYAFALSLVGKDALAPNEITLEVDKRAGVLRWRVPQLGRRWQSAPPVGYTLANSGGDRGVSAMARLPGAFAAHGIDKGVSHLRFLYDSRSQLQVDLLTHRESDRAQRVWTFRGTTPRAAAMTGRR